MDGRGRLAQSVTRSNPRSRPAAASRGLVSRCARRITLPLAHVRVPRFAGAVASLMFLGAAAIYGVVKGEHVPTIVSRHQGYGRRGRERDGHAHRDRVAVGAASGEPRGDFRGRRRHGSFVASVPRCCRRTRQARSNPVDRRSDRAQALSRSPADHRHGTRAVRAVAAAGQGQGDRRRRHGAVREGRAAARLALRSW